jgi:hypothetical protein
LTKALVQALTKRRPWMAKALAEAQGLETVARALAKVKVWPRVLAKTWAEVLAAEVLAKASSAMVMARQTKTLANALAQDA